MSEMNDGEKLAAQFANKNADDPQETTKLPSFIDLCFSEALYKEFDFSDIPTLIEFYRYSGTHDVFCVECGKTSTFIFNKALLDSFPQRTDIVQTQIYVISDKTLMPVFICARNNKHQS